MGELSKLGQVELYVSLMPKDCLHRTTYVRELDELVLGDSLGDLVDPVGDFLGCGSTVGDVELDTEIVVGSTGVVARGQQDPTISLLLPDQSRDSGGREDRVLSEDNVLDSITGRKLENDLDGLGGKVSPVSTDY